MKLRETVRRSLALIGPRGRRRYWRALAVQIVLALMDLVGVLLMAGVGVVIGSIAVGTALPAVVTDTAARFGLGGLSSQQLALVFGLGAAVFLVFKSLFSLLVQSRLRLFLAARTTEVASDMTTRFLAQPLIEVQRRPSHWNSWAFIDGLTSAVTTVLGHFLVIVGEVAVLVVLGVALLIIDPLTTVIAAVYFGLVVWLLTRRLGRRSAEAARRGDAAAIAGRSAVADAIATYREVTVAGRRDFFRDRIVRERSRLATAAADTVYIMSVPRFGMEAALVIGSLLVVGLMLMTRDVVGAVGGLFLFLSAATRVTPALLRLNASLLWMRAAGESSQRTFTLADELSSVPAPNPGTNVEGGRGPGAAYDIVASGVTLRYPGRAEPALVGVSLAIPAGTSVAIVGPTGAGKSSLVDVLTGVAVPTEGRVSIGGVSPSTYATVCPGSLAYVPQEVAVIHGSIRDNVALAVAADQVSDADVWAALDRAHLGEFVRALPTGLDTELGDRGVSISGGQQQRLGLARALYELPHILVLDEATSALDAETERAIADTVSALDGTITTITIAHRLATVREADMVVYIDEGRVMHVGDFRQVREAVPSFERQARLLGL